MSATVEGETSDFSYYAGGLRKSKDGTTYIYDGKEVLAEIEDDIVRLNVYGNALLITTTPTKATTPSQNKEKTTGTGRATNKMKPDPNATGEHTVFKKDAGGNITNYETFKPNPKSPTGFDSVVRYDSGQTHFDKSSGLHLDPLFMIGSTTAVYR